jgi:hypothetical protein
MPRVRVPRLVTRLVVPLVVDYFTYAARPGASARRAARRVARRRLLCLRRASGCLGTSHGLSCGSSSTTSPMPRVWVPRHVARLVTRLVVDYFAHTARPGASARRTARQRLLRLAQARRRLLCLAQARRRLLRPRRMSGYLSTSRGSLRGSSSTTSPAPHVRVPRHVARLVVDYFSYAVHPAASARRRLLRLVRLVVDYFAYAAPPSASAPRAARHRPHAIFAARFLVSRPHWLSPCTGHSVLRLGYSSPGCTSSTAYVVHQDTPFSPLDFSSGGRTGSSRAPGHSVSRLGYSPLGCTGSSAPMSCIRTRRLRCSTTRLRSHQQSAQVAQLSHLFK